MDWSVHSTETISSTGSQSWCRPIYPAVCQWHEDSVSRSGCRQINPLVRSPTVDLLTLKHFSHIIVISPTLFQINTIVSFVWSHFFPISKKKLLMSEKPMLETNLGPNFLEIKKNQQQKRNKTGSLKLKHFHFQLILSFPSRTNHDATESLIILKLNYVSLKERISKMSVKSLW